MPGRINTGLYWPQRLKTDFDTTLMELDSRGLIGTAIFHTLILLLFILFGFITPLPLPEEAGMTINFGDSETGLGTEELHENEETINNNQVQSIPEPVEEIKTEDPVMTQETEEAPAMVPVKKPAEKKPENKQHTEVQNPAPQQQQEEEPEVDNRAIYTGKKPNSNNTNSQGNTGGSGNQGSPTGSTDATNYGLGGGSGNVPGFYLDGRNPVSLPVPALDTPKEGKVVVQIKVDQAGNIVDATPGVKGSTTLDSYLLGIAKKAALSSKFDSNLNAPYYQTGTITYIFRLK